MASSDSGPPLAPDLRSLLKSVGMVSVSSWTADYLVATNFPMGSKGSSIESVGFSVWLMPNGTDPGQYVAIRVSFDGGTTWSPKYSVRSVGRDVRVDETNLPTWDVSKLSTTSLYLNVTHESDPGTTGNVSLDYLGATAIWTTYWHPMGSATSRRNLFSPLPVALP